MYANSFSVEINRLLTSYVVGYLNIQSHRTAVVLLGLGISAPNSIDPRRQCSLPDDRKSNRLINLKIPAFMSRNLKMNNPGRF